MPWPRASPFRNIFATHGHHQWPEPAAPIGVIMLRMREMDSSHCTRMTCLDYGRERELEIQNVMNGKCKFASLRRAVDFY